MQDETQQALWNFDGAELYLIFQIKSSIVAALEKWNIEEAYSKLRLLRMELDAKLSRGNKKIIEEFEKENEQSALFGKSKDKIKQEKKLTEKETVDDLINKLDIAYSVFIEMPNPLEKEKSAIYKSLEYVYMELSYLMKKHGLYFREGEDMRLAVLKK